MLRSKAEILKEHYGVETPREANPIAFEDPDNDRPPREQWTTLILPYEAPTHPAIPSFDEIDRAMETNPLTLPGGLYNVCIVGQCAIKYCGDPLILQVRLLYPVARYIYNFQKEAENLLFLQENSQVRTPKVYAVLARPLGSEECYYLIMEFIEGEILSTELWMSLNNDAHKKICSKISDQLQLLRAIPSEGYYGRVHHQGFSPAVTLFRVRYKHMNGPYDTYEDCISAMYTSAEHRVTIMDWGEEHIPEAELYLPKFKRTLSEWGSHEPTLTHLDLQLSNFIVQSGKKSGENADDWEVVIIDWAEAGWLPAWMQAVSLSQRFGLAIGDYKVDKRGTTEFIQRVTQKFEEPYSEQMAFFQDLHIMGYDLL